MLLRLFDMSESQMRGLHYVSSEKITCGTGNTDYNSKFTVSGSGKHSYKTWQRGRPKR